MPGKNCKSGGLFNTTVSSKGVVEWLFELYLNLPSMEVNVVSFCGVPAMELKSTLYHERSIRQCVFKSVRSLKGATKRRVRSLKGATKRREGNCDYFSQFIKPYSHTLEVENKSAPMPRLSCRNLGRVSRC